ncbi:hypothetical protein [Amycolatopsis thermoflava]|uniref:hypothetical protein n=1 Tax=Amycolatopsis thermoflava TaxID=84480 RepID=UPI00381CF5EB
MPTELLLARPVAGSVGERERVAHLIPMPQEPGSPAYLRACCGARFGPGELELLDQIAGMPCEECLVKAPGAESPGLDQPSPGILARLAAIESRLESFSTQLASVLELVAGPDRKADHEDNRDG